MGGLLVDTAAALVRRAGAIVVLAAVVCALVIGLAVTCHRDAPAPAVVIAPVATPPELVRAEVASVKAETVYVRVAAHVASVAYTYDGARAHVPALGTADTLGTVRVDTGFVTSSDSLRRALPALEDAAMQRHTADSAKVAALGLFVGALQDTIAETRRQRDEREEPCRVLGVACPSRTQAAVGGVTIGLGLAAWLVHSLR